MLARAITAPMKLSSMAAGSKIIPARSVLKQISSEKVLDPRNLIGEGVLWTHLQRVLPASHLPTCLRFVWSFPLTPTGKINKRSCAELLLHGGGATRKVLSRGPASEQKDGDVELSKEVSTRTSRKRVEEDSVAPLEQSSAAASNRALARHVATAWNELLELGAEIDESLPCCLDLGPACEQTSFFDIGVCSHAGPSLSICFKFQKTTPPPPRGNFAKSAEFAWYSRFLARPRFTRDATARAEFARREGMGGEEGGGRGGEGGGEQGRWGGGRGG